MAERLGRHAILFHARCRLNLPPLSETLVHDHFEVFVGRQDQALGIGTAIGAHSWFVYDLDPAPHRGSGRRPDRVACRDEGSRSSRSYIRSIKRTFEGLISHFSDGTTLTLNVDGRADYRAALRQSRLEGRVELRRFPNPKRGPKGSKRSPEAIERDHAMFPVDQLHQLLRHSCSDHKRETIAFGRRLESVMGRAHLMTVWKNFIKSRSERRSDKTTPAMRLGLTDTRWRFERLLCRRLFPGRERLTEIASTNYRKFLTRGLPVLALKHAT
jgi:hypothetical protein